MVRDTGEGLWMTGQILLEVLRANKSIDITRLHQGLPAFSADSVLVAVSQLLEFGKAELVGGRHLELARGPFNIKMRWTGEDWTVTANDPYSAYNFTSHGKETMGEALSEIVKVVSATNTINSDLPRYRLREETEEAPR